MGWVDLITIPNNIILLEEIIYVFGIIIDQTDGGIG